MSCIALVFQGDIQQGWVGSFVYMSNYKFPQILDSVVEYLYGV
jgi:hypothetical protein